MKSFYLLFSGLLLFTCQPAEKNQQEVLLPVMENNSILVIGASTENPFFSLTSAIRSRSMLFELYHI